MSDKRSGGPGEKKYGTNKDKSFDQLTDKERRDIIVKGGGKK